MDGEEFTTLVTPLMSKIAKFTRYYFAGFPSYGEEAQQEALKSAWENRGQLKDKSKFEPWLMKIVVNTCHRVYGGMRKDDYIDPQGIEQSGEEFPSMSSPLSQTEMKLRAKLED